MRFVFRMICSRGAALVKPRVDIREGPAKSRVSLMTQDDQTQSIFEVLEANVLEVEELRIFTLQMVNLLISIKNELNLNEQDHPKSIANFKDLLKSNDQIMQSVLSRQERMRTVLMKLEESGLQPAKGISVERTDLPSVEEILEHRV